MNMYAEGQKITAIRRYIDETYQGFGISTDTPMPPPDL